MLPNAVDGGEMHTGRKGEKTKGAVVIKVHLNVHKKQEEAEEKKRIATRVGKP